MSLQQEAIEAHKARRARIAAAAWKPPVKIEPVVEVIPEPVVEVIPEPEAPPVMPTRPAQDTLLLQILSNTPVTFTVHPPVRKIQAIVAAYYNISVAELLSPRRRRVLVGPRQLAMYLCDELTPLSYCEIGRRFGGRDHTTSRHAILKIAEQVKTDQWLADEVEKLKKLIQGEPE